MTENGLELRTYSPHPLLTPFVQCYWVVRSSNASSAEVRYLHPDGGHGIAFNFGASLANGDDFLRARVSIGRRLLAPRRLRFEGGVYIAGIRLLPQGAFPLFRTAGLSEEVVGVAGLEELFCRAAELPSPAALPALFDEWLIALYGGGELSPTVAAAIRRLEAAHGAVRIESIARDLSVTPRHLERLFNEHIGYSPKQLARIKRVRAAKRALAGGAGSLTQVALRFGYSDQAHFTREFSAMIGIPPAEYRLRSGARLRGTQEAMR